MTEHFVEAPSAPITWSYSRLHDFSFTWWSQETLGSFIKQNCEEHVSYKIPNHSQIFYLGLIATSLVRVDDKSVQGEAKKVMRRIDGWILWRKSI